MKANREVSSKPRSLADVPSGPGNARSLGIASPFRMRVDSSERGTLECQSRESSTALPGPWGRPRLRGFSTLPRLAIWDCLRRGWQSEIASVEATDLRKGLPSPPTNASPRASTAILAISDGYDRQRREATTAPPGPSGVPPRHEASLPKAFGTKRRSFGRGLLTPSDEASPRASKAI